MTETVVSLLLENSIVFSALFGGVWLIKRIFRKHMSVRLHYLIWAVVIMKLLVPFSIPAPWSPAVMLTVPVPQAQQETVQQESQPAPDMDLPVAQQAVTSSPQSNAVRQPYVPPAAATVDWAEVALSVWLAGIAVYTAWLWRKWHQLQKAFHRSSITAPDREQRVFLSCKRAIGLRREVRLMVQNVLQVPAAAGLIRPVVLVPPDFNTIETEHVFIHELAHIKRGDIAVIWGLNILRALYWFHPLVWVCFKQIQRDMEADCDSMAVETLGSQKLSGYIETILYFSGKDRPASLRAAMSLSDGCTQMKQRIRSMFMKKRTKGPVKLVVLGLAAAMVFAAFTSGCGMVPVQTDQKNDIVVEQWNDDDIQLDNVTIRIDAQVLKPDRDKFSIYETQRVGFAPEQIDKTIAHFFGDEQPDSQQKIDLIRRDAATGITDSTYLITGEKWEGGKLLEWTDTGEGKPGSAYIVNGIDYSGISPCIQISTGREPYFDRYPPYDRQPDGVSLTPDQAILKAQELLDALGLDDIKPRYVYACSAEDDETGEIISELPGGYDVVCIPSVNGMNAGYAHENTATTDNRETIDIYVNDSGVVRFDWINHWENGAATVNVTLLPFDDIKRIFKEEMVQKYKKSSFKTEHTVHKVVLELARVNTSDTWRLVPAWCFYSTSASGDYDDVIMDIHQGSMLLCINAVDGSVIE